MVMANPLEIAQTVIIMSVRRRILVRSVIFRISPCKNSIVHDGKGARWKPKPAEPQPKEELSGQEVRPCRANKIHVFAFSFRFPTICNSERADNNGLKSDVKGNMTGNEDY